MVLETSKKSGGSKTAIDAPRESIFRMRPEDITIIGIDTKDGPEHPLHDKNLRHEIHEPTVINLMEFGIDQTVSVWKNPEGQICAVDGRRRIIHAREANKRLAKKGEVPIIVPVRLRKGTPEMMERVSAALNSVRMDESLIVKADKVCRMLRRNGGDYAEVAITIGATEQTVRNYEKIMSLPTKVKNAVNDGQISASAAVKLSGLSNEEAESTLDKLVSESAGKKVSVSKVTRTRKKQNGGLIAPRKGTLKKLVAVESELDPEFLRGVRFAIGDLDPASVKGLKSLLADL